MKRLRPTLEQLQATFEVTLEGTNTLVACGIYETAPVVQERLRILASLRRRILAMKKVAKLSSREQS